MIVRNECHVIERCLDNVRHLLDAVAIVDTGSEDDTVPIIERYLAQHRLPGCVEKEKWREFDGSRNDALRLGEKVISSLTAPTPPQDGPLAEDEQQPLGEEVWYLLFMDADNLLHANGVEGKVFTFDKSRLTADAYKISMRRNNCVYDYVWLVKIHPTKLWHWDLPRHEAVCALGDWTPTWGRIGGGYIESRAEGDRANDPVRYLQDAVVLERELIKREKKGEKKNSRLIFYLAQSYRDSCKYKEALHWYSKRAQMGGWIEEVYVSWLEAGKAVLYHDPAAGEKALPYFFRAHNTLPRRKEAAHRIVEHWRAQGLFAMAWTFSKTLVTFRRYEGGLFVDDTVDTWQFNDAAAICAYYAGDKEECRLITERNLATYSDLISPEQQERMRKNLSYCT
jgi:glycosyltransferase involved in cell wall biosynthesis